MSKILEYFRLPDKMISLCVKDGKPMVVIQEDGELRSWQALSLLDAIEIFDFCVQRELDGQVRN